MTNSKNPKLTAADFRMFEERAARGLDVARAIDAGTPIPYSYTVVSHTFDDFFKALTPRRLELLQLSKAGQRSVAELAAKVHRDHSSVSRDIAKLVELGLLSVFVERNGDLVRKVVKPAAQSIEISAAPR